MANEQIKGKWSEVKGKLQQKWGYLTDDDMEQVHGEWGQLSGKLMQYYGWGKDEVKEKINDFLKDNHLLENGQSKLAGLDKFLEQSKDKIKEVAQDAQDSSAEVLKTVTSYLKKRPAVAIGAGAVVGILFMALINR